MKNFIALLFSIAISLQGFGQKRTIDVGSFSELSLGISGTVYLKQGPNEKVEIKCDDEIYDKIEFQESGDKLVIKSKKQNWKWNSGWNRSEVAIYVTMRSIEGLYISGSGRIESDDVLKMKTSQLSISGSGNMEFEISSDKIDLNISGSGSLLLKGEANESAVKISGSGKIKAKDCTFKSVSASISGSGSCYITATKSVSAKISGSGSVYYDGEPTVIVSKSSGSGKLRKM